MHTVSRASTTASRSTSRPPYRLRSATTSHASAPARMTSAATSSSVSDPREHLQVALYGIGALALGSVIERRRLESNVREQTAGTLRAGWRRPRWKRLFLFWMAVTGPRNRGYQARPQAGCFGEWATSIRKASTATAPRVGLQRFGARARAGPRPRL